MELKEHLSCAAKKRWEKIGKKERSEIMKEVRAAAKNKNKRNAPNLYGKH